MTWHQRWAWKFIWSWDFGFSTCNLHNYQNTVLQALCFSFGIGQNQLLVRPWKSNILFGSRHPPHFLHSLSSISLLALPSSVGLHTLSSKKHPHYIFKLVFLFAILVADVAFFYGFDTGYQTPINTVEQIQTAHGFRSDFNSSICNFMTQYSSSSKMIT